MQQGYATRFRVLGTQVRRLLRRRPPIVPRNSSRIALHTFGDDPIPLATNIALIVGWLGQEFPFASRHPDEYRDGVPYVVVIVYLTKTRNYTENIAPTYITPQGL